ncbi:MAG: hypothetical protein GTO30_09615, partial [Acidobacteria bacterium]|nr:hypothetical protein [Acidobacteriota bacterium]NIQ85816.1 hypothetical protein [Acidobacteriota bacterium]
MDGMERSGGIRAVAIAGLLSLAPTAAAQQAMFRNYSVEDGLAQSQVETVIQDGQGYLWSGTHHGLSRFDGHAFTNFTVRDGIADNIVTAAHVDLPGNLWFGHPSGNVTRYAGDLFEVFRAAEGWRGSRIQSFADDDFGTLWIATEGSGLLALRPEAGKGPSPVPSSPRRVRALVSWQDRMWLGAADGLYSFRPVEGDATPRFDALTTPAAFVHDIRALAADDSGKLWIGTSDAGLWVLPEVGGAPFRVAGLPRGPISELELDPAGFLWISAEGRGAWKIPTTLDGKRVSDLLTFTVKDGLNYNTVQDIRVDREGNVWFGTNGGGLAVYLGGLFESTAHSDNPEVLAVWSMMIDESGVMWMGTDGGLVRYLRKDAGREQTSEVFTVADGLAHNAVRAVHLDASGVLWLASKGGGLSTFDRASGRVTRYGPLPTDKMLSMVGG